MYMDRTEYGLQLYPTCKILAGYLNQFLHQQCYGTPCGEIWSYTLTIMPEPVYNFARKAMQQQLPTAANLARWKQTCDSSCQLCNSGKPQTNKHVLSNCSSLAALERYKRRHSGILETLADWLPIAG